MKIAYLSGAYKNAGDFLIEERSLALIRHFLKNAGITRFLRSELPGKCAALNEFDVVMIGGGPIFMKDISGYLPVEELTETLKKPVMIIGGGWYGNTGSLREVYSYHFTEPTKRFLEKADREGFGLSTRDIYTYRVLRKEGLKNVRLTGCPAWYDLGLVSSGTLREPEGDVRKIVVSDPARAYNYPQAVETVRYLRERWPEASLRFVFHRGLKADRYTSGKAAGRAGQLKDAVSPYCDEISDIAYSADGFRIYDDCDLHVGFRVHAHIYNLSRRNRSVLIEEDGRGAGVNQVLGLPSLKAYSDDLQVGSPRLHKVKSRLKMMRYTHLAEDLSTQLDLLETAGNVYFENAFRIQQACFREMERFIRQAEAL